MTKYLIKVKFCIRKCEKQHYVYLEKRAISFTRAMRSHHTHPLSCANAYSKCVRTCTVPTLTSLYEAIRSELLPPSFPCICTL